MKNEKAAKSKQRDRIVVGIAMGPVLHAKLRTAADEERRTISQFVRVLVERALEAKSA